MPNSFHNLLYRRRTEYKRMVPIYCPTLREYVYFNSDGFNHLRFRVDGSPRKPEEQMYKMGLLPLVAPTIINAKSVDKYERRLAPIGRKKVNGGPILKEIEYWGLIAVVGQQNVKVNVVLRRIGNGKIHFWSVMKLGENQKPL
jgi:hypothetical protein